MGLNSAGPLKCIFWSVNILENVLESCDTEYEKIFFSLAYFLVRIQCVIHILYRIGVNQLYVIHKASSQQQAISS